MWETEERKEMAWTKGVRRERGRENYAENFLMTLAMTGGVR
jgi:hypothetical protein